MSIRVKLIMAVTAILVGAFVLISLFNYNVTRKNIHDEIVYSALPLTRDNIYSEIQSGLMRPIFVSSLMANDTFLQDWTAYGEKDPNAIKRYLSEIQDEYGFFSAFFVSASTRKYYYPGGVLKKVSEQDRHDVWYYDFVKSGEGFDLDVDTNEAASNILTIFINHRVEDNDGKFLGVAGVGLKMDKVSKLLASFSEKYSKQIFLVDLAGVVQAHSNVNLIEKVNIKNLPGLMTVAEQMLSPNSEPAIFEFSAGGEKEYLTTRYIPEFEWVLVVQQSERGSLGAARDNLSRTLLVGGGTTLLILLLSILTINHFQIRLEKQAGTDALTGLANRRAFENRFDIAMNNYFRNGNDFSIILLDIDGFKRVNDLCGHLQGDNLIKDISSKVCSAIRNDDFCARWGGDEFIILVSGNVDIAMSVAERIRSSACCNCKCGDDSAEGEEVRITVSCGVAGFNMDDSLDSLAQRADKAMYESKVLGKDRVVKG
ncbi:sensor domain-containing diguanylate cyclase [Desulfovibrio sp. JC022]|uniref:sensor domain-containing diguanylate cyclase n=1 Tax=Desulfovibrio sp. JC022 TaxID=2593642 RepID=UPI0013D88B70|nr:sensor domain-containing diguanylate cyclase [Desulfovibrio sp. JC022]NDV22583.1 GGDEF domain-containing protein [Desulfovibrio sp. JC022]